MPGELEQVIAFLQGETQATGDRGEHLLLSPFLPISPYSGRSWCRPNPRPVAHRFDALGDGGHDRGTDRHPHGGLVPASGRRTTDERPGAVAVFRPGNGNARVSRGAECTGAGPHPPDLEKA
ncbi:hypothetical protein GCM10010340_25820 [Streptomyces griseoloalbus]|nr:hypothetical protein GCM10010340_25820 [Streptomyces albaduncus]